MQMKMVWCVCGILDAGVAVDWQCWSMVAVAECSRRVRGAVPQPSLLTSREVKIGNTA
jgi:hypothetical protein